MKEVLNSVAFKTGVVIFKIPKEFRPQPGNYEKHSIVFKLPEGVPAGTKMKLTLEADFTPNRTSVECLQWLDSKGWLEVAYPDGVSDPEGVCVEVDLDAGSTRQP